MSLKCKMCVIHEFIHLQLISGWHVSLRLCRLDDLLFPEHG